MKLMVTTDAHIFRAPDGTYWCGAIYGYNFWKRYMDIFDTIRVVARVKNVSTIEKKWLRVDGENVEIFAIPFYQGPIQLVMNYTKIQKALKFVFDDCDAALFRLPSPTGQLVMKKKRKSDSIPLGLEVVYDLTDDLKDFHEGIISHLIARIQVAQLKKACIRANGVSYVTKETIQRNFPSYSRLCGESKTHFETYYSTITLDEEAYGSPRDFTGQKTFTFILSDVAMNSERKGEKVFIEAISLLRNRGWDIKGIIIGDGTMRSSFESYAKELKISSEIQFTGLLSSSKEVREYLKKADVFVFPTRAEGLPRGIIEAMAAGLPCVSSPVGGIPEIINAEYLAEPTDAKAYSLILQDLLSDTNKMNQISAQNIKIALEFKNETLQKRRNEFYSMLYSLCKEER